MSDNGVVRTQYFDRQFLRPQDFSDEQAYHIAMRRRHNIAHHRWGIVLGLQLVIDDKTSIYIQPGMAIDGYGREVIVGERMSVSPSAFDRHNADTLDIWVLYDRADSDTSPAGYNGCGKGTIGNGQSGDHYRWRERALQIATRADPNPDADRRKPNRVLAGDLGFPPHRNPPDDPEQAWPIFLGQVTRVRGNPDSYTVNLDNRPYAGLVGEQIVTPDGGARVQIGSERSDDARRFAVFLNEADSESELGPASPYLPSCHDTAPSHSAAQGATPPAPKPVLEIDKDGKVGIRHDTTFLGNAILHNGALDLRLDRRDAATAKPWSIYHAAPAGNPALEELRIEMPEEGDAQVSIGVWSADEKKFVPCLTIKNNCEVVVFGDLKVAGDLTDSSGHYPTKQYTEAAMGMLLASFQQGMAGAPFAAGGAPAAAPIEIN